MCVSYFTTILTLNMTNKKVYLFIALPPVELFQSLQNSLFSTGSSTSNCSFWKGSCNENIRHFYQQTWFLYDIYSHFPEKEMGNYQNNSSLNQSKKGLFHNFQIHKSISKWPHICWPKYTIEPFQNGLFEVGDPIWNSMIVGFKNSNMAEQIF